MAGFLYYLAGRDKTIGPRELAEAGLAYAFEGRQATALVLHGPDGGSGVIVADPTRIEAGQIGYWPERQTWRRMNAQPGAAAPVAAGDGPATWAGTWNDARPGPADLQRQVMLAGVGVELGDGQTWQVPIARAFREIDGQLVWTSGLPRTDQLDEAGRWVPGDVLPAYAELWQIACRVWDAFTASLAQEGQAGPGAAQQTQAPETARLVLDFAGECEAAAAILAVNYRISAAEISMLGLLHDLCRPRVLLATIDYATLVEWLQKKASTERPAPAG